LGISPEPVEFGHDQLFAITDPVQERAELQPLVGGGGALTP
jgi:hypothetical protein